MDDYKIIYLGDIGDTVVSGEYFCKLGTKRKDIIKDLKEKFNFDMIIFVTALKV